MALVVGLYDARPMLARGTADVSRAYRLFALGRCAEARRELSQVVELAAQGDAPALDSSAAHLQCLIDLSQGRLASAWTRMTLFNPRLSLTPDIVRSIVLYERDELVETWPVLMENLPNVIDGDSPDALIVTCVLASRIAMSRDDPVASRHYLAVLERAAQDRACTRMRCSVWIERARVATLEGRLERAAQALVQIDRCASWERTEFLFYSNDVDTPTIVHLRLLIAQGHCDKATRMLRPAIDVACLRGHLRRALKLRLLHAMALDGVGRQDEAFAELTGALQLASHEGWRRTFLEEGACLAALLQRWAQVCPVRRSVLGVDAIFLNDLLKRLPVGSIQPKDGQQPLCETLTEREHEVVGLLAEGRQMRDIAGHLQLSEHTVKTHLRNIYRKLGAHGRAEAAAIARARGLLER